MPPTSAVAEQAACLLSHYIQFDTTNPPGAERAALEWLAQVIADLGITSEVSLLGSERDRPILIARVGQGQQPALVLNHHADVVPADASAWTHPPFAGEIADGYVWGRGALDCKGQGIIFLLGLAQLVAEGAHFTRPVIYLAVPDEECGGQHGTVWLLEHEPQALNLGEAKTCWVWDEGGVGVADILPDRPLVGISVAEKRVLQLLITAHGEAGHASQHTPNSAPVRLLRSLNRVLGPRPIRLNAVTRRMWQAIAQTRTGTQRFVLNNLHRWPLSAVLGERLAGSGLLSAMLRDTVSLTQLEGSSAPNVVPGTARAVLDCRLLPDTDVSTFRAELVEALADDQVAVETLEDGDPGAISPLDDPLYAAIVESIRAHWPDAMVAPVQMPAASDSRFYRQRGLAAYGLTPIIVPSSDIATIHGVDERLSLDNLALGISVTHDVLQSFCTTQE